MKTFFKKLKNSGILGINSRNLEFIQKYNQRKFYPNADSKFIAKNLAIKANIPVPEMYGMINFSGEVDKVLEILKDKKEIVIKPEHGSGGNGIIIASFIDDKISIGGNLYDWSKLRFHSNNILSGLFSLGGQVDRILIEEKVKFSNVFTKVAYQGVPDIRIIVFKEIPVMAMLRLPTKKSNGKANLHQGAVGVGIDLKTGITTHGTLGAKLCKVHPDTNNNISDLQIPFWNEMLEIAVKSPEVFKLGYMGIDLVLDQDKGPLMLEANVRPGLAIQLANQIGLRNRLKKVEKMNVEGLSDLEKIEVSINF